MEVPRRNCNAPEVGLPMTSMRRGCEMSISWGIGCIVSHVEEFNGWKWRWKSGLEHHARFT